MVVPGQTTMSEVDVWGTFSVLILVRMSEILVCAKKGMLF